MLYGEIIPKKTLSPEQFKTLAEDIIKWANEDSEVFWITRHPLKDMLSGKPPRSLESLYPRLESIKGLSEYEGFIAFGILPRDDHLSVTLSNVAGCIDVECIVDIIIDTSSWKKASGR